MNQIMPLAFSCRLCRRIIFAFLLLPGLSMAQSNVFPSTGNVGIGTTSPTTRLHVKTDGTVSAWIGLDKNAGQENGLQFMKAGNALFYLYSDNLDSDALKIQSTGASGENDALPRIHIPYASRDLYLAQSGGRVGIGTSAPTASLHVVSSTTNIGENTVKFSAPAIGSISSHIHYGTTGDWYVRSASSNGKVVIQDYNGGKVGIGTDNPQTKLHIANGDLLLQNQSSGYPILWMKDVSGNNAVRFDYNSVIHAGGNFRIRSGGTNYLLLNDSDGGNVGIGTANPNEKLTVNGTIYGKEVKVDLSVPGPDYVFEKDYNLPSLEEIKTYIDQHKHLPEVPSAKEMEENGINVGEMNMILLKKVEELTLYILEMRQHEKIASERLESLETEIQLLKNKK